MNTNALPDGLRHALGKVIADVRREWRLEAERQAAESRAVAAEMKAEVLRLREEAKAHAETQTSRVDAAIETIESREASVTKQLAELQEAAGDHLIGKGMADLFGGLTANIHNQVSEAVDKRMSELVIPPGDKGEQGLPGADGRDGLNGKDVDPAEVAAVVQTEVAKAMAELVIPKGEPGADGRDGVDGKSVDEVELAALVSTAVEQAVSAIPVVKGDPGKDGKDGAPGEPGKDGVGLASALVNRSGELVVTLTDGTTKELGQVVGKDGAAGVDGAPGTNGRDGFGFDDLDITYDGERGLAFKWEKGEHAEVRSFVLPIPIDRGVYKSEGAFQRGDGVSYDGSFWIAQDTTSDRPGLSKTWRLAVKHGREGKAGKDGKDGTPGATGRAGKDLTQLGPDGSKW